MSHRDLSVSVVTYSPDMAVLERCVRDLKQSAKIATKMGLLGRCNLTLVDNGPGEAFAPRLRKLLITLWDDPECESKYLRSGENVGYARGHNLAILGQDSDFHLILNPDVYMQSDALVVALAFAMRHEDVGLITPAVYGPGGERQYLCKEHPTLYDLFCRRFAPRWWRRLAAARMARYEMRQMDYDRVIFGVKYASGCFMWVRGPLLRKLGGFDPRFFMYLEDADLTRRILRVSSTAYVPTVRVVHLWSRGTHTSLRLLLVTVHSAFVYFRKWGWRIL
jgi:GT2 family glycosyltransferase